MHRWDDNINIDLREMQRCGFYSFGSGYGLLAGSCQYGNQRLGSKVGNFLTS
jgi:hypothetical protein